MGRQLEFAGSVGRTRSETVQFRCPDGTVVAATVHRAVNVATDPELARKFLDEDPGRALNRVAHGDHSHPVHVSVIYHDPKHELMVLVLPESERHLELVRRSELLLELSRCADAVRHIGAAAE